MRALVRNVATASLLILCSAVQALAQAESYPNKPVKIVLDSAPGSAIDVSLRIVADKLTQLWGQQVLPFNHPGGGGSIAARVAASAPPDGYTLYIPAASAFITLPGAAANFPLEVPRDFAPIGMMNQLPMFIASPANLNVANLAELIELARKKPGEIAFAATGVGRMTHLTGELLQIRTGVKMLLVPYSGGPAHALNDIMSGRVQMIIEAYSGLAGAIQGGQLKALAVASEQRVPGFPDLPTVAETIPGFHAYGWQVMVAPAGTPEPILRKISADLRTALEDPTVQKRFATLGGAVRPMAPAEATAFIQQEQQMWKPALDQIAAGTKR